MSCGWLMFRRVERWSSSRTFPISVSAWLSSCLTAASSGHRCAGSRTDVLAFPSDCRIERDFLMGRAMIRARIAEDESERRQLPRLPVELEAKMRELGSEGVEARV